MGRQWGSIARGVTSPGCGSWTAPPQRGKTPPLKPVPKPSETPAAAQTPAKPPPMDRAPDKLEAFYGAFLIRDPRLRARDEFQVSDELSHPGLRRLLAQVFQGTAVEEALYVWAQHPGADFGDCLLTARAAHLGRSRFLTFDAAAARLPGVELLA